MEIGKVANSGFHVGAGRRLHPAGELGDGTLDVAPVEVPGVLDQRLANVIGKDAYYTEVHVTDGVARQDNDIGRVNIGVEVAVDVNLVEHVPVNVLGYALQAV